MGDIDLGDEDGEDHKRKRSDEEEGKSEDDDV